MPANLTGPAGPDKAIASYNPFGDAGFRMVLLGNLVVIWLAQDQQWSLGEILWVYWTQSVIIGVMNVIRMATLKSFSTENFKMNGRSVKPTTATKYQTAIFFAVHFGFFHLAYLGFLKTVHGGDFSNAGIGVAVALFLASHAVSLVAGRGRGEDETKLNIGSLMFLPYLRILPMHLIIIAGSDAGQNSLLVFMLMKTAADTGMHVVEHLIYRHGRRLWLEENRTAQ